MHVKRTSISIANLTAPMLAKRRCCNLTDTQTVFRLVIGGSLNYLEPRLTAVY
jgi:hypothetical protein